MLEVCILNLPLVNIQMYKILIETHTNIHDAVLFSVKEKPIIEERKFGIRCSNV